MTTYPAEVKAQVIADWMAGASLGQLVKTYEVKKPTIQTWVRNRERLAVQVSTPKREPYNLDKLAVDLVDGSGKALVAIFRLAEDTEWLRQQNAADLAIYAGVISDKLYRLLGAVTAAPTVDDPA